MLAYGDLRAPSVAVAYGGDLEARVQAAGRQGKARHYAVEEDSPELDLEAEAEAEPDQLEAQSSSSAYANCTAPSWRERKCSALYGTSFTNIFWFNLISNTHNHYLVGTLWLC